MFKLSGSIPQGSIMAPITTSDKFILSQKNVEVPSHINGSYSYTGNSRIEFDLNSPSDFINFQESYFRCDLSTDLSFEGADCTSRYLSEGGINSLFREVRLETQGGVLIDRIIRYNKFYSMMSGILHSKEFVDTHLQASGDSVDIQPKGKGLSVFKTSSGSSFAYDHTGGAAERLLTGTGSDFLNQVNVGDIVLLIDNDGTNYTVSVSAVLSATTLTIDGVGTADFTADSMYIVKPDEGVEPARNRVAKTDNSVVTCQLLLPFMQMEQWFPLFLVRSGLRLVIELERPEFVLAAPTDVVSSGFTGASYSISKATYVAKFIKPSEALAQQYVQMYKQQGLSYHIISYEHRMNVVSAGSVGVQNLRLQVNGRSARHLLSFIQDERAETVTSATVNSGKSTFTCDSVAQKIKANLAEWQVEVGSERYPQSSPMDVTSVDNAEILTELEKTMGIYGLGVTSHRWSPSEWVEVQSKYKEFEQGAYDGKADSTRLILPANFSRDDSPWSGIDVTLHSINVLPNFDAAYQLSDMDGSNGVDKPLYVHSFVGLDKVIMLSESGGLTTLI